LSQHSLVTSVLARQPLTVLAKISCGALLFGGILSGVFAVVLGLPAGVALATVSVIQVLGAALLTTGLRWAPAFSAALAGSMLYYALFVNPYPAYHFAHPKPQFAAFVPALLGVALMVLTCGTSLAALAQNYRGGDGRMPRWLPAALTGLGGVVAGAILIAALVQPVTASAPITTAPGEPVVHLGPATFAQSSVTVPVGSKLLLADDAGDLHILDYGAWQNGSAHGAGQPAGAPPLHDLRIEGGTVELGPFTAPGTYDVYCVLHPGMNLRIIVQ